LTETKAWFISYHPAWKQNQPILQLPEPTASYKYNIHVHCGIGVLHIHIEKSPR